MTDAPNSVSEFGWRKPHPRRTPPLVCFHSSVGGGLRPAPLGECSFSVPISVISGTFPASRRGGPMCPPGHTSARDPFAGRHTGRPLQILSETSSCPRSRAGTEPRPYRRQRRRMPNAGSRSTRLLSPSSPASQNARNDSRHQSIHLSSPVSAQRSVRARLPESPVTPGWFPKEGPRPFLWSFQGGLGGKYESHRSSSAHSAFDRSQNPGCHPPAGGALRCLTPPDG